MGKPSPWGLVWSWTEEVIWQLFLCFVDFCSSTRIKVRDAVLCHARPLSIRSKEKKIGLCARHQRIQEKLK